MLICRIPWFQSPDNLTYWLLGKLTHVVQMLRMLSGTPQGVLTLSPLNGFFEWDILPGMLSGTSENRLPDCTEEFRMEEMMISRNC